MGETIKKNKLFLVGAIFSLLFIIAMVVVDVLPSMNWTVEKYSKTLAKAKPPVAHISWLVVFYFTFQSNVLVMIYLFLRAFGILKPKEKEGHKLFQVIVTVNITITMVVYWLLLAPFSSIWTHTGVAGAMKRMTTIMVHFIVPVFMLVAFHADKLKKDEEGVVLSYKKVGFVLIYPIVWMLIAIIVYYITREEHSFKLVHNTHGYKLVEQAGAPISKTYGVSIYFFLGFDLEPVFLPIAAAFGITAMFLGFGFLFFAVSNPNSKIQKCKFKKKQKSEA